MGSKGSGEVSFTIPDGSKWWDSNTVAVVTGANKGIGYGIASIFAHVGLKTVVTARNEQLGEEAVAKIKEQTGSDNVLFHRLDIADPASVDTFAKWAEGHASPISILVNNAGMAFKGNIFGAEEAQTTLDTNFVGTRSVCERLAPLLADGGRVVNVCSSAGKLRILRSPELASRFTSAKSGDDVAALAGEFVQGIKSGRFEQEGWPGSMYGVSKLCEATYTRILAEQLAPRNICVTACCPGYVATDMSSHRGVKTIEEGADTPAWLALLAPLDSSGKFYKDRKLESF